MNKNMLLPDRMVRKIVAETGAVLIMQWAHNYEITKSWSVWYPAGSGRTTVLRYHLSLVVPNEELRTRYELVTAVNNLCRPPLRLVVEVIRLKQAIQAIRHNDRSFATIYRIGWSLYNADKNSFPQPGIACTLQPPVKRKG